MVAAQLDRQFEGAKGTAWRTRRLGGLYEIAVTLDQASGRLDRRVELAVPVRWATVGTLPATLLALVAGSSTAAHLALLWVSAALVVVSVGHVLPGVVEPLAIVDGAETDGRRLGLLAVPAVVSALLSLWVILRTVQSPLVADAITLTLCIVAGTAYGTVATTSDSAVSPVGIPLSGFLAPTFVLTNLVVLAAATESGGSLALIAAVLLGCLLTVLFGVYCTVAVSTYRQSRIRPTTGWRRIGTGGVYAVGCGSVVAAPLLAASYVSPWQWVDRLLVAAEAMPLLAPEQTAVITVLVAHGPLLVVWVAWLVALGTAVTTRPCLIRRGQTRACPATEDGTTLLVVDSDRPFVRPLWWFGRYVVVGDGVVEALTDAQLAAVVAHERYHLRRRERAVGLLATGIGILPGGRNAILSFVELPATEHGADDHAAAVVGRTHLIRALRRLERLRAAREKTEPTSSVVRVMLAPYRLFYGRLLLEQAHDTVDERIARLDETTSE